MAAIQPNDTAAHVPGKRRAKKLSLHIDMTPMVDLAFLLLSFFVLTAVFNKLKSMELYFPHNGEPTRIKNGITLLLSGNNRIFYYEGEFKGENEKPNATVLHELNFDLTASNSLANFLRVKNANLIAEIQSITAQKRNHNISDSESRQLILQAKSGSQALTYLVKADENATYGNVVSVLNALNKNLVSNYAVCNIAETEATMLREKTRQTH